MDTLRDWWVTLRTSSYSPIRMWVSTLLSYLRNEKIPVAERKAYWYLVQSDYLADLSEKDFAFIKRLLHTSDHSKTTFESWLQPTLHSDEMV